MLNKTISIFLFLCYVLIINAQTPSSVKQLLDAPFMKGAAFSLVVKDVHSGKIVCSYNTDLQVSPASVMKTISTAAALELLGEDYRFPTSLEYDGVIENGVLKGNLYIKGSGDPTLGSSHFASDKNTYTPDQNKFIPEWITAIKKAGIKKISGAVISDESVFDTEGISPKWSWEDMGNYYSAGSYGLSVFDNLYNLSLKTGAPGSRPEITGSDPDVSFIHFNNYMKAGAISSDNAYIIGAPFIADRSLYGMIPANRKNFVLKGDIPDPALFLAQYLTDNLRREGIITTGSPSCYRIEAETGKWKENPRKAIVTTYSPTIKEIAKVTNYVSHNLFADAMIKTIGLQYIPKKDEVISSFERGISIVNDHWKKKGLDISTCWMYDGSGLAPTDKVSAGFMGEFLTYMATESDVSESFTASLPLAGMDGSVRNFLKDTNLIGKARLKSGGISRVRSYAGYVTKDGKTYAVAVFANNYSCSMGEMTKALEKLLVQLFN